MIERKEKRDLKEIIDIRVKKEVEFPENLEKRFGALFAAIGNSEAKCLTLLCLAQSPLTSYEVRQKFLRESGEVWKTSPGTTAAYCLDTLIPIGMVVEADILHYGLTVWVTSFKLTEAGIKYGQPIAAFLLEQSSKLPHSLLEIFGPTSKGGGETRAVLTRAKILEFLSQTDTVQREIDITNQLKLRGHSQLHLRYLSQLGLVEYSSITVEEPGFAKYILSENAARDKVEKVGTEPKLSSEVANLLFQLRKVDTNLLTKKLKRKHPKSSIDSLRNRISMILSDFSKQGACYHELFVGGKIQSQAKITQTGKDLVSEIILPIKRALADDKNLLSSWREIPWWDYAEKDIGKHKKASGWVNSRPLKEWTQKALTVISQNPGLRRKEIKSLLNYNCSDLLKILLGQGKIRKEKQGKAVRYYLQ